MRALITGGAGFIGSNLAERLLTRGYSVAALDDFSTGRIDNIAHLEDDSDFACYRGTVLDSQLVSQLVCDSDVVFHLAAAVGVRRVLQDPVTSLQVNVLGTDNVLNACAKHEKKVVVASSAEVYGKAPSGCSSEGGAVSEDHSLTFPSTGKLRWNYACAKAMKEYLAYAYAFEHSLRFSIVRLCNTVGPRQIGRYGMVLPNFIRAAVEGNPITVFGDGLQRRCFAHVNDVVRGLIACAELHEAIGEVFNLGTTEEVTLNELAELVRTVTGSSSPIHHLPYDQAYGDGFDEILSFCPDLSKARKLLGYRPEWSLADIVADLVVRARQARAEEGMDRPQSLRVQCESA